MTVVKKYNDIIYTFLNLLRLVLDRICCICLPGTFGNWFNLNLIFLLIICLDYLSIVENKIVKTPTITVLLSIFPFSCICFFFFSNAEMLGNLNFYNCYFFLMDYPLNHSIMAFFVFFVHI